MTNSTDSGKHTGPMQLLAELVCAGADNAQSEYDGQVFSFCTACGQNDMTTGRIEHTASCAWQRVYVAIAEHGSAA